MNLIKGLIVFHFLLCSTAFADTCQTTTKSLSHMDERFVELIDDAGESILLRVKVADEAHEQAAGFQHICATTIETTAILFVFEKPKEPLFHMNNVHANLDIAFIDEKGAIGDVQLMLEEFSSGESKLYPSQVNTKYALEVRQGYFSEHNISPLGGRIVIDE